MANDLFGLSGRCELCTVQCEDLRPALVFVQKLKVSENTARLCEKCDALRWITEEFELAIQRIVAQRENRDVEGLRRELLERVQERTLFSGGEG